ncbi:MAG: PAS domain-containing protein [Opitutaceae bacterium]|nr:PAS domain-containing protein [Opitutaceae bacterium]
MDPESRQIIDANPFLVQLLGFTHEEFLGKELFEIGLYRDATASQSSFRELQQTGYVRYDDLPLETKDGRHIHVEFVSNLYQEGDRQVIQCNIRDISARKLADAALRESEERFKLVARAVSDVVWDWDLMTDLLWWSDGFQTAFGYSAAEIEPGIESWRERLHPDERQRVVAGIHRAIDQGLFAWTDEYQFRCRHGGYALVQDSGYIIHDTAGQPVRMVGGMRDRTEQKRLEAQYFRAQRMESIGTLAGGIAHDLNNVLTPIMMSIELLRADEGDDPDSNTIINNIQTSCHRGAELVRQVLSFARGVEGQRLPIHLKDLIEELRGIIGETFPRDITIALRVAEDLWPMTGDPTQLHQVLLNLAINARDAMPHGGTLTLAAANVALDAQFAGTLRAAKAGRYILLQAEDTGLGIPFGIRERIFEPFFTTKELGKGTGLGLATVDAIIKGHGGFVTLDSEMGRGTTFNVYLPADPARADNPAQPPLPDELRRGRGELVLVVDDEPAIRLVTQRTLETLGYRVFTAGDGAEALAVYAKHQQEIDLVLTDIMMPILDGEATIHVLKRLNPAVRIVAVSGLDIAENIAKITRAGVKDFLPKPYTALTLARVLREVLDRTPQCPCR